MRTALIFGLVASIVSLSFAADADPVHDIGISADVPTITVAPRRAGRITMSLPGLTYAMTLTVDCDADWQPDSVSISVADSRTSFNAEQLQAGRELHLDLRIPPNQIAPLRIEKFCVAADPDTPDTSIQNRITVAGVLSALASLRCATDSEQSTMYVTKPLDVVLECAAPALTDE